MIKSLIFSAVILVGCRSTQKANERFYSKTFLVDAPVKVMKLHFETPAEDQSVSSYTISRSTTGRYWYTVKSVTANKRPSIYDFDIPYSYGYYRIKVNKINGIIYSRNLYVNR